MINMQSVVFAPQAAGLPLATIRMEESEKYVLMRVHI